MYENPHFDFSGVGWPDHVLGPMGWSANVSTMQRYVDDILLPKSSKTSNPFKTQEIPAQRLTADQGPNKNIRSISTFFKTIFSRYLFISNLKPVVFSHRGVCLHLALEIGPLPCWAARPMRRVDGHHVATSARRVPLPPATAPGGRLWGWVKRWGINND